MRNHAVLSRGDMSNDGVGRGAFLPHSDIKAPRPQNLPPENRLETVERLLASAKSDVAPDLLYGTRGWDEVQLEMQAQPVFRAAAEDGFGQLAGDFRRSGGGDAETRGCAGVGVLLAGADPAIEDDVASGGRHDLKMDGVAASPGLGHAKRSGWTR